MTTTTRAGHAIGPCPDCGYVIASTETTQVTCPACTARVALTWVVGAHNERMPCDSRCQYAVRDHCSCQCGGDNHGAGYIQVDVVPAWVRQRDADRHTAKVAARAAKAAAEKARRRDVRADLIAEHPDLADLADTDRYWGRFADDMRTALQRGEMTPRQIEAAVDMVHRTREREAAQAERDARKAAAAAAGVTAPTGRVTFAGTIRTVRIDDNRFSYNGTVWKCLIESDDGWSVWGTFPRSLNTSDRLEEYRGRRVTVTATVAPKGDDSLFGIMTRPRAAYIDQPETTGAAA